MSIINKNSFSRWIIEKSDGLTKFGLQRLSQTVRDYAYLILMSQTSMKGQIVDHTERNLDAQQVFLNTFENIIIRGLIFHKTYKGFKRLCNMLEVK